MSKSVWQQQQPFSQQQEVQKPLYSHEEYQPIRLPQQHTPYRIFSDKENEKERQEHERIKREVRQECEEMMSRSGLGVDWNLTMPEKEKRPVKCANEEEYLQQLRETDEKYKTRKNAFHE